MSLDDEIRQAERRGDTALAERLKARLLPSDEGYRWRTLDGKVLRLHQITDGHLENILKMKIRRFEMTQGLLHPRSRTAHRLFRPNEIAETMAWKSFELVNEPLLKEADRRGMNRAEWFGYFHAVIDRCCDECGKNRRTVEYRGPTQRLQCATCARVWRLRCLKCRLTNKTKDQRWPAACDISWRIRKWRHVTSEDKCNGQIIYEPYERKTG